VIFHNSKPPGRGTSLQGGAWLELARFFHGSGAGGTYAAEKTRGVYVSDVNISGLDCSSELPGARQSTASGILDRIGVHLNWRAATPRSRR
jgi:hypothetical protein